MEVPEAAGRARQARSKKGRGTSDGPGLTLSQNWEGETLNGRNPTKGRLFKTDRTAADYFAFERLPNFGAPQPPRPRPFLRQLNSPNRNAIMAAVQGAISKRRKFVADGVFYAELNEFFQRELAEEGYSGVEVRVTPTVIDISTSPD